MRRNGIRLTVVDHHSVALELLSGGAVLDVGARGYEFARYFAERGHRVTALEPDVTAEQPKIERVEILPVALVGRDPGVRRLVLHPNPEARYIAPAGEGTKYPITQVQGMSITELSKECGVDQWDLMKLNCEGEEADILENWPGPVAKQIVCSWHQHFRPIPEDRIEAIISRLTQWYRVIRHEKDARYGGGMNWWDDVYLLKE